MDASFHGIQRVGKQTKIGGLICQEEEQEPELVARP